MYGGLSNGEGNEGSVDSVQKKIPLASMLWSEIFVVLLDAGFGFEPLLDEAEQENSNSQNFMQNQGGDKGPGYQNLSSSSVLILCVIPLVWFDRNFLILSSLFPGLSVGRMFSWCARWQTEYMDRCSRCVLAL